MVITKDEFKKKKIDPNMQRVGKNQTSILELLQKNKEEAFSQAEIQLELGIEYMSAVNYALHSLRKKGLVESRVVKGIIYWRATDAKGVPDVLSQSDGDSEEESSKEEE